MFDDNDYFIKSSDLRKVLAEEIQKAFADYLPILRQYNDLRSEVNEATKWKSTQKTCEILGISRTTIQAMIKDPQKFKLLEKHILRRGHKNFYDVAGIIQVMKKWEGVYFKNYRFRDKLPDIQQKLSEQKL